MTYSHWIRLQEASCHNCMRCVRACPTNAMTYVHHQPEILEEECILCGRCYAVCPHDAKAVISQLDQVKRWLDEKQEVILSLAPSFAAIWPNLDALEYLLRGRGFSYVEETAVGAAMVSQAFAQLAEQGTMENIITTCCPAINTLIEKEYGELTKYMAPVASPLIVHGRSLKKAHPQAKVVFLSPCIAKYKEIQDARFAGAVDACIGMEELIDWIASSHLPQEEETWHSFTNAIARLYPTPGGILSTLPQNTKYNYVNVDGTENVKKLLDAMKEGSLKGYFVEVNACAGSCFGGPLLQHLKHNEWLGQARIRKNVDIARKIQPARADVDVSAEWKPEYVWHSSFSEDEIQAELIAEGKTSPDRIHDCGACGYATCRLKAIAVLEGRADPAICLPMALEQARSLSSVIIDNTPNGIIVLNKDGMVQEMNPSGREMLNLGMVNPTGMPVAAILPDDALLRLVSMTKPGQTENMRVEYPQYRKVIDHAIVKLEDPSYTVIILMDRTGEENQARQLQAMRERTLKITDSVIEEQMRTVQEIASLLGETTAHSKVALTQLKEAIDKKGS